jgi:hypothetical protein
MEFREKFKMWVGENLLSISWCTAMIVFFTMIGMLIHNDLKVDRTPKPTAFELECLDLGGLVLTNSKVVGKMTYSTENCVDQKMFIKTEMKAR